MKIGILGAGQLAQMMGEAAPQLSADVISLSFSPEDCAKRTTTLFPVTDWNDPAILEFAQSVDILTFETENIPAGLADNLALEKPFFPPPHALKIAQDRLLEKHFFQKIGLQTAPFLTVNSFSELEDAIKTLGTPGILKTRRMGYDGKGQYKINTADEAQAAWDKLNVTDLIYESFVPFETEISLIGARSRNGEIAFYPLCENLHIDGILRKTQVPLLNEKLNAEAQSVLHHIMTALDYVGILTVEFFVAHGALLGNEIAPRVHNSGHWTIEGAETSQFEQHLRAIMGLPLGSTALTAPHCTMINCIGELPKTPPEKGILHDYGKQPREGRKVGHITILE